MKTFTPPGNITNLKTIKNIKIFLGGSIEQGEAEEWQQKARKLIAKYETVNTIVFNPRRDDYQPDAKQTLDNQYFFEQVTWELEAQEISDYKIYYFDPKTKSMITLLELGKYGDEKTLVICNEGYCRKGNVDIFCNKYNIPQFKTLEEAIKSIFVEIKK